MTVPPLLPITLQAGPCTLRPFAEKDVPSIFEASRDPLIPLITTVPNPCDQAAALAFIARQHERLQTGQGWSLAIAEGASPALGQIGLWPQSHERASLGYWVLPSARGRGWRRWLWRPCRALALLNSSGWNCMWSRGTIPIAVKSLIC
ncbi:hypothetical protein Dxin01_02629 [Deinococcus xinjiangensis]|uniref:N-acetyltransferase domain-containing protein n=1 Tax=Deinococcus xinjiangensis TaxID=457454 RepID=A0ABP9VGR5_9DEIO